MDQTVRQAWDKGVADMREAAARTVENAGRELAAPTRNELMLLDWLARSIRSVPVRPRVDQADQADQAAMGATPDWLKPQADAARRQIAEQPAALRAIYEADIRSAMDGQSGCGPRGRHR